MKILKYKVFNEGIIGKAKEIINRKTVLENNKVADKYLKMIMDDYEKKKNLIKLHINLHKEYDKLLYLIDDTEFNVPKESTGEEHIKIELTYIKSNSWNNDISNARIKVTKFEPYKGDTHLIGRDLDTNQIFDDPNGKNGNFSYLNISSKPVKKIIDFFIKEFTDKYPTLKNSGTLSATQITEVDRRLRMRIKDHHDNKTKSYKRLVEDYTKYYNENFEKIKLNGKLQLEDVEDIFIEITDNYSKDLTLVIKSALYKNGYLFYVHRYATIFTVPANMISKFNESKIYYIVIIQRNGEDDEIALQQLMRFGSIDGSNEMAEFDYIINQNLKKSTNLNKIEVIESGLVNVHGYDVYKKSKLSLINLMSSHGVGQFIAILTSKD